MNDSVFDVCVVGCGPFGCFTAMLLSQQGLRVCIISDENIQPMQTFQNSLNACWASLNDPSTRALVAHGREVADYLELFCSKGCSLFSSEILKIIHDENNWVASTSLRIGLKDFEIEELEESCFLGFSLKKSNIRGTFIETNDNLLCLNKDQFQKKVIESLKIMNIPVIHSAARHLNESHSGCSIELENGELINSEIVVLANSLSIANLLPKYKNILLPMSDCLFEYECNANPKFKINPVSFRASNGHICATLIEFEKKIILRVSGPRFMLPKSGVAVDLTQTEISDDVFKRIETFHRKYIFDILSEQLLIENQNEFIKEFPFELKTKCVFVDCLPCDELPVLGEYGKFGKILGNAGWIATGFSAGAQAAKIMRDLILNEKSEDLHKRLATTRMFNPFL